MNDKIYKMKNHQDHFLFLKDCFQNNFPHSWIFHGPHGVGKYKFTIEFIKSVCHLKNVNQNVFEINNPEHPALIEDVRELISQIKLTNSSTMIQKTFFLVHQMEHLNLNCINALLKTIEEPPENTVIIIFTPNLRNIPKTILSRCVKLRFKVNDSEDFLEHKTINKENFLMSNYNPKILYLLNDKKGEHIKQRITNLLNKTNFELSEFYELYAKISENFNNYLSMILSVIFFKIKSQITTRVYNLDKTKDALNYLDFVKNISNNELKIDKKKTLHLILSEYFKFNLNK